MAGPGKRDEVAGGVCALLLSCDACGIDVSNISARSNDENVRSARLSVWAIRVNSVRVPKIAYSSESQVRHSMPALIWLPGSFRLVKPDISQRDLQLSGWE